jgi:hypothetical protein
MPSTQELKVQMATIMAQIEEAERREAEEQKKAEEEEARRLAELEHKRKLEEKRRVEQAEMERQQQAEEAEMRRSAAHIGNGVSEKALRKRAASPPAHDMGTKKARTEPEPEEEAEQGLDVDRILWEIRQLQKAQSEEMQALREGIEDVLDRQCLMMNRIADVFSTLVDHIVRPASESESEMGSAKKVAKEAVCEVAEEVAELGDNVPV